MGDAERKGRDGLLKKRRRAGLGFLVIDGQVDGARGAVDRDIEIAFAPLAVGGLELSAYPSRANSTQKGLAN